MGQGILGRHADGQGSDAQGGDQREDVVVEMLEDDDQGCTHQEQRNDLLGNRNHLARHDRTAGSVLAPLNVPFQKFVKRLIDQIEYEYDQYDVQ